MPENCITELTAVQKGEIIVGHVPQDYSCICFLFLRQGSSITITAVNGPRDDLERGGLEYPVFIHLAVSYEQDEESSYELKEIMIDITQIMIMTQKYRPHKMSQRRMMMYHGLQSGTLS